jgi:hypothetical protein
MLLILAMDDAMNWPKDNGNHLSKMTICSNIKGTGTVVVGNVN